MPLYLIARHNFSKLCSYLAQKYLLEYIFLQDLLITKKTIGHGLLTIYVQFDSIIRGPRHHPVNPGSVHNINIGRRSPNPLVLPVHAGSRLTYNKH